MEREAVANGGMNMKHAQQELTSYRIGTVSRITGIPVDTLRVWERRYNVVRPRRGKGSGRHYSRADITRLSMLKALVDKGDAIGSIADFSNNQLRARLRTLKQVTGARPVPPNYPVRVCVYGQLLPLQLEDIAANDPCVIFSGLHQNLSGFETALAAAPADVIVLEYAAIHQDTANEILRVINRHNTQLVIILYGYASSRILDAFRSSPQHVRLMQTPCPVPDLIDEIKRLAAIPEQSMSLAEAEADSAAPAPPRIFDNKGLVQITQVSNTIKCECPRHLAKIIQQLIQFEMYSSECENSNEQDAKLHARLKAMTGRARFVMESALLRVIKEEGILAD